MDVENQQVWQAERQISLKPKTFAVLRYLIERPGRLVAKEELLEALWPGVYVTDGVLKTSIREIRYALGERASDPQFIETVHRRGYRFIGKFADSLPSRGLEAPTPPQQSVVASDTPSIVGREAELIQLQNWWQSALQGKRQLVFVTGEPGIGKTTLVDAFLVEVATQAWHARGQCVEQYGAGEAYLPVLEALNRLCQRAGSEALVSSLERYAPSWLVQMPALLVDEHFEKLKLRVAGATLERMLREMAEALEAFTHMQPLILWLEDLHWADHATIELLSYLARRPEPARLMVIGTYRPADLIVTGHPLREVSQEVFAKGIGVECPLEFLNREAVTAYVTSRLGDEMDTATQLGPVIHQRTEGNAPFMVSVVNHLVEQGLLSKTGARLSESDSIHAIADTIPSGLRQLIERQLERLSPEQQRLLEIASVSGTEFTAFAVASGTDTDVELVEEQCEQLAVSGQFLMEIGFTEWDNGTISGRYRFRHALYQQALYDRLAQVRRTRLHKAIGQALESVYGKSAGSVAAELAVHFERGRTIEKAIQYYYKAGELAVRRSANREAVAHFTKSLALLSELPSTPERDQQELSLQLALGAPLIALNGLAAPAVERTYGRARELCKDQAETTLNFAILLGLHAFYIVRGRLEVGLEFARRSFRVAQKIQDSECILEAEAYLGSSLFWNGDILGAKDHLEHATSLYDPQKHAAHAFFYGIDPGVVAYSMLARTSWILGYPDKASPYTQEALSIATRLAHAHSSAFATSYASLLYGFRGDWLDCQKWAEETVALASEHSLPLWLGLGIFEQGMAVAERTQGREELENIAEGISIYRSTGAEVALTEQLTAQAIWCGKTKSVTEGKRILREALTIAQQNSEGYWEAELYRCQGELFLLSEEGASSVHRVEKCFRQALEIARQQEAKSLELRAAMSMSRLWQEQGKVTAAYELLAPIYEWFTEGFETADLKEAKALLEALA